MTNEQRNAHCIAVISGKGGVGKSVITANLAAALSSIGRKVLAVDADLGLASLDVILGIEPKFTIFDALQGGRSLDEIPIPTKNGFDVLPTGSGIPEAAAFTPVMGKNLEAAIRSLQNRYDVLLFDAGAGIGDVVLFFACLAHEILLVVTPEPTSIMDAYATLKILSQDYGKTEFLLLVNQADPHQPDRVAASIAGHLQKVISEYLASDNSIRVELIGSIPTDPMIPRSVRQRQLLEKIAPLAPSTVLLSRMARLLDRRISAC